MRGRETREIILDQPDWIILSTRARNGARGIIYIRGPVPLLRVAGCWRKIVVGVKYPKSHNEPSPMGRETRRFRWDKITAILNLLDKRAISRVVNFP